MVRHDYPKIVVSLHRDPRNADLVEYSIVKWWRKRDPEAKIGHHLESTQVDYGTFVHPKPITHIEVHYDEHGDTMSVYLSPRASVHTPGRERSGLENVPLPLEGLPEPQSEPPATTP